MYNLFLYHYLVCVCACVCMCVCVCVCVVLVVLSPTFSLLFFSINLLRLPEYPSKAVLEDRLQTALRCGGLGYGLVWRKHENGQQQQQKITKNDTINKIKKKSWTLYGFDHLKSLGTPPRIICLYTFGEIKSVWCNTRTFTDFCFVLLHWSQNQFIW